MGNLFTDIQNLLEVVMGDGHTLTAAGNGASPFYVIAAVYFTTFESVIVSRNTHRPCYVSKMAYSCRVQVITFVKA